MRILKRDNIFNRIIFWSFVIILIILAGGNNDNMDMYSSIYEYEHFTEYRQGEWFNFLIEDFFRNNNLTYEYYRLAIYAGGYILLFSTLVKFFGVNFYLLLLYAIYPFTMDFIQTPNFCSMSIIIYSTRFLVLFNKKNIIKFILCILFAAGMHSMAYIYLIIPILIYYSKGKNIFIIGKIILVTFLLLAILDRITGFIYPLAQFATQNDDRLSLYFGGYTKIGFILYWTIQFLLWYMMKYIVKKVEKSSKSRSKNHNIIAYLKVIYFVTCFGLLLIPLVGYAGTLFRLVRNYFILVYAAWAYYLKFFATNVEKYIYGIAFSIFPIFLFAIESPEVHLNALYLLVNNWIINN